MRSGYDDTFVYPGLAGGLFATFKDCVEIAVLCAVGYALWRRLVQKPARLERNREALVILSLIAAIMVTDFAFDGFRFALRASEVPRIAHERSFAFGGDAIAGLFSGLSPAMLQIGYHASYWIQMLTVLGFLVILPLGEHFHIVTALPALYLPPRRAGESRAAGRPRSADGRVTTRSSRSAYARRAISRGRTASMRSRAQNAAAARTRVRRSSPASRCR